MIPRHPRSGSSPPGVAPWLLAVVLLTGAQCSSSSPSRTNQASGGGTAVRGSSGGAGGRGGATGSTGGTISPSGGSGGTSQTGGSASATGGSRAGGSGGTAGGSGGTAGGSGGTTTSAGGRGGAAGGVSGQGGGSGGSGGSTAAGGAGGTTQAGGSSGSGSGGAIGTGGSVSGDIFVSPNGDDANPGTPDKPLATIAAAQAAVRAHPNRGKSPLTVAVLPGTYYVGKTIVFTTADSGAEAAPITYRGYGLPTLSGGVKLDLTWTAYKNNIMQASVPASLSSGMSFDVMFLNGQRQIMARYPNYDPNKLTTPFQGVAGDYQSRPSKWAKAPTGEVYAHCMHTSDWGSQHYVMSGVSGGSLNLSKALCNGRASGPNGSGVVENVLDELDAPGEWYFDKSAGTLYFNPPPGTDLGTALLEMAGLETIIQFQGTAGAPVKFVNLDGFRYHATSRTFGKCNEQVLKSDWVIYRGGGLFLSGVEDSAITNSFFDALGGNALFVSGYARRVNIQTNKLVGIGASAILLMGLSSAVRNPGFGYTGGIAVGSLDKTPGPKTDDYPAQCTVTDNLIHDIGYPQKQVAGVGLDLASEITVSHNSIYNVPRAGINIGDGCWGGHIIEYNDVFDTVLETGDHGAFNSWGRDRYWDPNIGTIESRVAASAGLELLDAMTPVIMRNNRWRCDRGWDVDLDDGSTNYVITDNIFLAGGLKWREGYHRTADNNMFAEQARMSVHVWPKGSDDVFTHNIFNHYDVVNPNGWGKTIDYNLFTDAAALSTARGYGIDAHSASGSPGYVDAARGDYQLAPASAALALGIKSIPAQSYGVVSLSLRAQARTPSFAATSVPTNPDAGARDPNPTTWRGAQVKNLMGLDERSATGMGDDIGVLVVAVPAGSQAATDGLRALDVILQLGSQSVVSLDDLNRLYAATTAGQKLTLGIRRDQRDVTLEITR
jgi:hypothetical protein